MKKYQMQTVASVDFSTDIATGAITYASFGGADDRQCVEVCEDSEFGRISSLLILWVCGFSFGLKNAVNDFLGGVIPIVKSRLKQFQGWFNQEEVDNILTDLWMKMSGNSPRKGSAFDPQKGALSSWIGFQVKAYTTQKSRMKKLAKKLLGLSVVVDDDTQLSSIGDKGLFGLVFESADNDQSPSKWTKMSRMENETFDRVARKEESAGLQKILSQLPDDNRQCLELYFVDGWTLADIGTKMSLTKMGVQKKILRTINAIRRHYGVEDSVLSLGGKTKMVKYVTID